MVRGANLLLPAAADYYPRGVTTKDVVKQDARVVNLIRKLSEGPSLFHSAVHHTCKRGGGQSVMQQGLAHIVQVCINI